MSVIPDDATSGVAFIATTLCDDKDQACCIAIHEEQVTS
jgi:hypothetical protein